MKIKILNAFSIGSTGGNPAGVVLDADNLSKAQMQDIASRMGLSETAFVSSSNVADFKLNFFTPEKQIPHCGHATIATFSYLRQTGKIKGDRSSKETIDGNRTIVFEGNNAFMEQKAPVYHHLGVDNLEILESLGINADDLQRGLDPLIVNTGNSFLIIPVKDTAILKNLLPDMEKLSDISKRYNFIGYYIYAPSSNPIYDATTLMFAPAYGINEESATGMAAGTLACYLFSQSGMQKSKFLIEQGRFMPSPSASEIIVQLELNGNTIEGLYAGGTAYEQETIEINL